ncbi:PREDICTED: uncharacterized protein LOC108519439 isoform X2 [Rhinopithecus bieti]|uniref:uncharacterized protein LOC108519439 isoform X2 n=1 Tax=Rhinopithecus bieti TaxID=61621 RepID=UPI00083BC370|nr:PREDICTED: uncharacterized protein LOC108519439 isoform X2 [Rhinopithecus bieti]
MQSRGSRCRFMPAHRTHLGPPPTAQDSPPTATLAWPRTGAPPSADPGAAVALHWETRARRGAEGARPSEEVLTSGLKSKGRATCREGSLISAASLGQVRGSSFGKADCALGDSTHRRWEAGCQPSLPSLLRPTVSLGSGTCLGRPTPPSAVHLLSGGSAPRSGSRILPWPSENGLGRSWNSSVSPGMQAGGSGGLSGGSEGGRPGPNCATFHPLPLGEQTPSTRAHSAIRVRTSMESSSLPKKSKVALGLRAGRAASSRLSTHQGGLGSLGQRCEPLGLTGRQDGAFREGGVKWFECRQRQVHTQIMDVLGTAVTPAAQRLSLQAGSGSPSFRLGPSVSPLSGGWGERQQHAFALRTSHLTVGRGSFCSPETSPGRNPGTPNSQGEAAKTCDRPSTLNLEIS